MLSSDSTVEQVENAGPALAILPVGATEQHGPHLPLGTDTLEAEAVARGVAEIMGAFCMPALPYSISHMHRGCPGTFWLRNETLRLVLHDLASSVLTSKFRYLMILNGHGGNRLLPAVIQDLNIDFPGLLSFSINLYDSLPTLEIFKPAAGLQHAEEVETSMIWHLRPELVHPEKFEANPQVIASDALLYDPLPLVSKLTYTGNPAEASPEKGQQALEHMVRTTVDTARRVIESVEGRRKSKVTSL